MIMRCLFCGALLAAAGLAMGAEATGGGAAGLAAKDKQMLNLWDGPAPLAQGTADIDVPALDVCAVPEGVKPSGGAMVVLPGGGYSHLSPREGRNIGEWLAKNGIASFVLRYRLGPKYHHPAEMLDGMRAMRFVRAHAADWAIDPHHIGIIGFSAGGHLASTVATHFDAGDEQASDPIDRVSSRPDVQVLLYPVITMGTGTHGGSLHSLLGAEPDPELVELLSNEKHVTKDTPPAFLCHSVQDTAVPMVTNTDLYAAALKAAGVKYEYINGTLGGHGFGFQDFWTDPCAAWLKKQGF